MNEIVFRVLAFAGGLLLGVVFFGGLWLTVKRTVTTKQPAVLVAGSFFFRTGIALTGFYFIGGGEWQRLLICLVGFIMARFIIIWLTKKEVHHEA